MQPPGVSSEGGHQPGNDCFSSALPHWQGPYHAVWISSRLPLWMLLRILDPPWTQQHCAECRLVSLPSDFAFDVATPPCLSSDVSLSPGSSWTSLLPLALRCTLLPLLLCNHSLVRVHGEHCSPLPFVVSCTPLLCFVQDSIPICALKGTTPL